MLFNQNDRKLFSAIAAPFNPVFEQTRQKRRAAQLERVCQSVGSKGTLPFYFSYFA